MAWPIELGHHVHVGPLVDAFVEPRLFGLVARDQALEPVVADLVFNGQVQIFICAFGDMDRRDGWVFHTAFVALPGLDGGDDIERVFADEGGAEADGVFDVFDAMMPG